MRQSNLKLTTSLCKIKRRTVVTSLSLIVFVALAAALILSAWHFAPAPQKSDVNNANAKLEKAYGELPLFFVANHGQTAPQVNFTAEGGGYSVFLTPQAAVLNLSHGKTSETAQRASVRMSFVEANSQPQISGEAELAGKFNRFVGDDESKWQRDVPTFARVRYDEIYSGVDLIFYGNQRELQYDFHVAPNADPNQIRLAFSDSVENLWVNEKGDLVLNFGEKNELLMRRPFVYQDETNGERREVAAGFDVRESGEIGFRLGAYDRSKTLVIDPVLSYATFLGGAGGSDYSYALAVDAAGAAYVTGSSNSNDFPTTPGAVRHADGNVFVTKFNPQGSQLVFSALVGGSSFEYGNGIDLDQSGAVYLTGITQSSDFPAVNAVKKRNLIFTTVNGGATWTNDSNLAPPTVNQVDDLTVAPGNPNVVYASGGGNFFRSADGGATWTVANAGLPSSPQILDIAVDPFASETVYAGLSNGLYRTTNGGQSWSPAPPLFTGFAALSIVFDPVNQGTVYVSRNGVFRTTNGGTTWEAVWSGLPVNGNYKLAIDSQNPATLYAGTVNWGVFKTTNSGASWTAVNNGIEGFLSNSIQTIAISPSNPQVLYVATGSRQIYRTVNGAQSWVAVNQNLGAFVEPKAILIDPTNHLNVYAAIPGQGVMRTSNGGQNWSPSNGGLYFNTVNALAIHGSNPNRLFAATTFDDGRTDVFIAKLNPTGNALVYSSKFGGSNDESSGDVAVDADGNAYFAGWTFSNNIPIAAPFQPILKGSSDAFLAKIAPAGGSLLFSTYLGGASTEVANDVETDDGGSAIVVGGTSSSDFPILNAFQPNFRNGDAFITKFAPNGAALQFSTYLGGIGSDAASSLTLDQTGNIYLTGTASNDFPLLNPLQSAWRPLFVTKMNSSASALIYSTYFGGTRNDVINDIAADQYGNAFVTGGTESFDFPLIRSLKIKSPYFRSLDGGATWNNYHPGINGEYFYNFAFHPQTPAVMFAATSNGAFRSADNGSSWTRIGGETLPGAATIAIDPQNPNIMFAGGFSGGGLYRSINGGGAWTKLTQAPINNITVLDIVFDPLNPQNIYVCSDFTIYKTTDGGNNWTRVADNSISFPVDLTINKQNPNILYVAVIHSGGGVWRSTNAGQTWTRLTNGIVTGHADFVETDPGNGSIVYAGASNGMLKSTDGGDSWQPLATAPTNRNLAIDPRTPSILYQIKGTSAIATSELFKSTDGGATWASNGLLPEKHFGRKIAADPFFNGTLHFGGQLFPSDTDAFVTKINPSGTAFVYSSIFGGTSETPGVTASDTGFGVGIDAAGNAYVSGLTNQRDFPVTPGSFDPTFNGNFNQLDAFVSKFEESWSVSGVISETNGNRVGNVRLAMTSTLRPQTATSDNVGNYSFPFVRAGDSVAITPRKLGYDFTPATHAVNNLSRDEQRNFVATYITYTVSGRITANGGGLANVAVSLNGSTSGATTTDANGNYSFTVPKYGDYTVRPQLFGYIFTPQTRSFTNVVADQTADFTAVAGYAISGKISRNDQPIAGATVTLAGATGNQTQTTDATGNYSFDAAAGGNYLITPSLAGYAFAPENRAAANFSAPLEANFEAIRLPEIAGKIVFARQVDFSNSQTEIYTMDDEGNAVTRLTNTTAFESAPDFSPNGRQIVYSSLAATGGSRLFVMNSDGSNQRQIAGSLTSASAPDWSPAASKIAFVGNTSFGSEFSQIYATNADGSGLTQLTNNPSIRYNSEPIWTPDGSKIIFYGFTNSNSSLFIMNADGSNVQQIPNLPAGANYPAISPDATKIAFSSSILGNNGIYVINLDGSGLRQLTNVWSDINPQWSPDGTRITFSRDTGSSANIYTINADGTNLKKLTLQNVGNVTPNWQPRLRVMPPADFDGDSKTDLTVFRPSNGHWYSLGSRNRNFTATQFGADGDKPVGADYDGDGRTDIAVFRSGAWYVLRSSNNVFQAISFGLGNDVPVPADFDGDLKTDIAVFRPANGSWYALLSSTQTLFAVPFGANGDAPVPADYDGDGRADPAVYRRSTGNWFVLQSVNNYFRTAQLGSAEDIPVPADFDGDAKADLALFRPSNGTWYFINSSGGMFSAAQFGASGDIPVAGMFDDDRKTDIAVLRGGVWYVLHSGNATFQFDFFGSAGDQPVFPVNAP